VIAVSFDFDGVLARSPFAHGVLFPVLDELAGRYAQREGVDTDDAKECVRDLVWGHFRRRIAEGAYVEAYDWQTIVARAADDLRLDFTSSLPELTREFSARLACGHDGSLVYPGVREALSGLSARGLCLILLTNGFRAYQWPTADALGIAEFFQSFFASDDIGTVKPFREAFDRAFASCPDSDGLRFHVGDSLTQDVAGARGAGVRAVWVHHDLPGDLARCSPGERARHPGIDEVIRAKLEREDQAAVSFRPEECRPDDVIMSVEEVELVVG